MNVSRYEKVDTYYSAEVCQKKLCSKVDNLIKIEKKRGVEDNKLMYNMKDEDLLFLPIRIAESPMASDIRSTLDESQSCWHIDPCHKNLKKYCCNDSVSDQIIGNNNLNNSYMYIYIGFLIFLFFALAVFMSRTPKYTT